MTQKGTVLITGGARRIGEALALAFAHQGYDIALHYFTSESDAKNTARSVEALGRSCHIFPTDLNESLQYKTLIDNVFSNYPDCNILINNASLFEQSSFLDTTEALFDHHMNINFKAPYFLTQYFAKHCKDGQVINILDSYVSKNKSPYFIYLLSKKILYDFTKMAAAELGPALRINGVSPGITELSQGLDSEWLERKKHTLPLRSVAKVDDIVAAVMHIVAADYMTGQIVSVDGGEHLL